MLFGIAEIKADLAYLILQVIERYLDGARCAIGIEQNKGCRAAGTGVSTIVTEKRRAGISRARAVIERFIAVLGTGTEEAVIIRAGAASVGAGTATAGITSITVTTVIAGGSVIGMSTYSDPVTLIIGTNITIIGAGGACRIKTAVGSFLTGVTIGFRTGASYVGRAGSRRAGITSITVKSVITGRSVIRVAAACANCAHVVNAEICVRTET